MLLMLVLESNFSHTSAANFSEEFLLRTHASFNEEFLLHS